MKKIDVRLSLPTPMGRRYLVFMFGADQRHGKALGENAPLEKERRKNSPWGVAFVFMTILVWFLIGGAILSFVFLYLFKSYAGWDIFKGQSPFQEILHALRICHNIKK